MTLRSLVLRDESGNVHPDRWRIDRHYGGLFIDDGTGFVSAATPTAEKVDASPVKVGQLNGVTADAAERAATASGQLTIARSGDYQVSAHGDCLSGNAAVVVVEVFKNGAVVADAAASPGGAIKADLKMAGTAVKMGWAISPSMLRGLVVGDTLDLRVTSDVGTVTIKQLRFHVEQRNDSDPVFEG